MAPVQEEPVMKRGLFSDLSGIAADPCSIQAIRLKTPPVAKKP